MVILLKTWESLVLPHLRLTRSCNSPCYSWPEKGDDEKVCLHGARVRMPVRNRR